MPVDKTPLFRARVRMLRTQEATRSTRLQSPQQQQEKGVSSPAINSDAKPVESKKELPENGQHYHFLTYTAEARQIRQQLTILRNLVLNSRRDYVSDIGHSKKLIACDTDSMSNLELDDLDTKIEKLMRGCIQSIQTLKRKVDNNLNIRALDEGPHLFEVLRILGKHFNGTAKIVAEMRALRTEKMNTVRRTCRLATLAELYSKKKCKQEMSVEVSPTPKYSETKSYISVSDSLLSDSIIFGKEGLRRRGQRSVSRTKMEEIPKLETNECLDAQLSGFQENGEIGNGEMLNDLDNDERAQLMVENERIYSRSLQVDSDIQKVERQLMELHQLQETFAEKVSEQEKDIHLVNQTTVSTVENIRVGNEQIRLAIQNMASRRVILLFCIIVLTFTLLFLDWYNP